ncbi:MAG: HIT family protein [bacterium]|nr:HIT family protein [bacterium]
MDCIFCKIVSGELPSSKIYEDENVLAFLDIHPVNPGHTLVVTKKHFEGIHDTPDDLICKIVLTAKKIAGAIQSKLGADGVNIGMNNGKEAGQIVFHSHIHIMPRYGDDSFKLWQGKSSNTEEREKIAEKIKLGLA